ncbi:putative membrane protein [Pacificibacter maritimus]|uniref:Putative membrane protein n=1 Tax=Pacificibacter maritimus TaxID=762213 RepID=A0A3N4VG14_9RHOB|nr:DUF2244 domain-containing protein [Pacificibacter maritimus]RPE71894.1 putative membrane protein [Pacificibacter maritimus]
MPYLWTPDHHSQARTAASLPATPQIPEMPLLKLDIWPHRSMPNRGFKNAIWLMFIAGCLPVIAFIGTLAFWILLACVLLTLTALWTGLRLSDRAHLREELTLWSDRLLLTHWTTKGEKLTYEANPYWVKLHLHAAGGPVEHYLTLTSSATDQGRSVELARFLSPEERCQLHDDLAFVLGQLKDLRR